MTDLTTFASVLRTCQTVATAAHADLDIQAHEDGLAIVLKIPVHVASSPAPPSLVQSNGIHSGPKDNRRRHKGGPTVAQTVRNILTDTPSKPFTAMDICEEIRQSHADILRAYNGDLRRLDTSVRQVVFRETEKGHMVRVGVGQYQAVPEPQMS